MPQPPGLLPPWPKIMHVNNFSVCLMMSVVVMQVNATAKNRVRGQMAPKLRPKGASKREVISTEINLISVEIVIAFCSEFVYDHCEDCV